MSDDVARLLVRQTTVTTMRFARVISEARRRGESVADLAERYGLDESTVVWWHAISNFPEPRDAPDGLVDKSAGYAP